ncbi:MAG: HesA/MoeB/ThiF family protein [Phycisphaerae bacterium]|nr:HesA/MoeB/ThiF family protein [Phycisphaerae bacterium]
MAAADRANLERFQRQIAFAPLGLEGQKRLAEARVLIVGVGGLGSWSAELLARAGVGMIRLVDDDRVDLANLHRQGLYDESDAAAARPKVQAAAARIGRISSRCRVEPIVARADHGSITALADGVDLILDGTDNFATRFVLNDYCVRADLPWIFAGVVAAEGQVLAIPPGGRPCLRCIYDQPPPPCADPSCRAAGVLGPAVAALAALQAAEAIKVLSGHGDQISPYLTKLDLWTNTLQRVDAARAAAAADCPCCKHGVYEFLEGP